MDAVTTLVEAQTMNDGHNAVLTLIQRAVKRFGVDRLSGGNCGTFALALATHLEQLGYQPKLGFFYLRREQRCTTIHEVIASETDIYHVFVMLNGRHYDGTGEVSVDDLFAIARDQYDDDDPSDFTDIDVDDRAMLSLIDNDTDWNLDAVAFYRAMQPRRGRSLTR
jgi:hypothetical protein